MTEAFEKNTWSARLLVLAVLSVLSACATSTVRVNNAATFASAGIAYVDAIPAVLDESFELSVTANSLTLSLARDDLPEDIRSSRLLDNDSLLEDRLKLLRDIKQHSLMLRSYFISLRALTSSENATGISTATSNLVGRLGELRPEIASATIGDASPQDLVGPAVNLAVGLFQNAALRAELEAHGEAIERELALQESVLNTLVQDMTANADLVIQIEDRNPVFEDFVTSGSLSATWNDRRIAAFRRTVELDSLADIQRAAANMHDTWMAFVENRADDGALNLLLQDIEQLLAAARLFRSDD